MVIDYRIPQTCQIHAKSHAWKSTMNLHELMHRPTIVYIPIHGDLVIVVHVKIKHASRKAGEMEME